MTVQVMVKVKVEEEIIVVLDSTICDGHWVRLLFDAGFLARHRCVVGERRKLLSDLRGPSHGTLSLHRRQPCDLEAQLQTERQEV